MAPFEFPNGARFAFTVIDDTDDATVESVKPVYDLLESVGMRTTKTVWPFWHDGPTNFFACETLEDDRYAAFVKDLQRQGFEIAWHCASFESNVRERTLAGLERFTGLFDTGPRVHANHSRNRENLYWGQGRVDYRWLRWLYGRAVGVSKDHYQGHVEGSPYWWGDACLEHVVYSRNLTFNRLNLATVNPSMPYRDPRRPLVPLWFSAADAESVDEFNRLVRSSNQERLEREGGFAIVATHFGKKFAPGGKLDTAFERTIREMASRNGWFPPVGELLDWLAGQRSALELPAREWRRMQLRWSFDLVVRRLAEWRSRRA